MPDDLQIPIADHGHAPGHSPGYADSGRIPTSATYRPRSSSRRATRAMPLRTVVMAAAAVCALLLLIVGGWSLLHRGPAQIPVVEADTRPVRVKPENPGGMQLADTDDGTTRPGDQSLAPAAEAPAPQALRAQMQQPMQQPAPAPAPAPAQVVAAIPAPEPAPVTTQAAPPAPAPAQPVTRAEAPRTVRPAAAPASTSGIAVQIAAVDSEPAAQAEWTRLQKRLPALLQDRRPVVLKAERDGHAFWRLRVPGFADIAEATAFCTKLRERGAACAIATF